jgi:hypothetical protein
MTGAERHSLDFQPVMKNPAFLSLYRATTKPYLAGPGPRPYCPRGIVTAGQDGSAGLGSEASRARPCRGRAHTGIQQTQRRTVAAWDHKAIFSCRRSGAGAHYIWGGSQNVLPTTRAPTLHLESLPAIPASGHASGSDGMSVNFYGAATAGDRAGD